MNENNKKLQAHFAPETAFAVEPVAAGHFRARQASRFERLKERLLCQRLAEAWEPDLSGQLRRAANDAAALAWVTPYPLLVFPVLFEEKAAAAGALAEHQALVRQRSRELLGV
jgi:hypothetical protein